MKLSIPHLVAKQGRTGPRYYWQPSATLRAAGWQSQRLPDDLAAATAAAARWNEAVASWREGCTATTPDGRRAAVRRAVRRHSIAALATAFRTDCKARVKAGDLAPATARQYGHALDAIAAWAGDQPPEWLTPSRCRHWLATLAGKQQQHPHRAAGHGRVLRTLLRWAQGTGRIASNPMDQVVIAVPKPRHQLWPDHAIMAVVAMADAMGRPSLGDAGVLAADTGQRQGDLLALTMAALPMVDGRRHARLQQGKTGVWVDVPLTQRAASRVTAARQRISGQKIIPAAVLVNETTGQAWRQSAFVHAMGQLIAATIAGSTAHGLPPCPALEGLQFRDLRRTLVVRLAEAGVDLPGIAAISGHQIAHCQKILETYLPRTGKMASAAIERLEQARRTPAPRAIERKEA